MTIATPAFAPLHQPKALNFDPARLNGISEKLIRSHWENNYGGSVKTLNAVKQKLAQALADKDTPAFAYDDLKREHLMRTGSVVFHELYFENLGGNGKADPDLRKAIGGAFGDFDTWETEFRKIGAGLGGGSGWGRSRLQRAYRPDRELLARRSSARPCGDTAAAGDGYVRAFVPDGLRRRGRQVHRCFLPKHPMGSGRGTLEPCRQPKTPGA